MIQHKFGLYEKALPRDLALSEKLRIAKDLGFDYFELSTDESEEFQARVTSDKSEIIEIRKAIEAYDMPIMTMCLSGTRNCPIGSENPELATKGMKLTRDAIHFCRNWSSHHSAYGIRRVLQYSQRKNICAFP